MAEKNSASIEFSNHSSSSVFPILPHFYLSALPPPPSPFNFRNFCSHQKTCLGNNRNFRLEWDMGGIVIVEMVLNLQVIVTYLQVTVLTYK